MSKNIKSAVTNKKGTVPKNAGAIPKPTGAIPKPTGAIPKPTGAIQKPTSAVPKTNIKPTIAVSKTTLKPTSAVPKTIIKPISATSKTTITGSKLSSGIPKSPGVDRKSPIAVSATSGVAIPKYVRTAAKHPNLVPKTRGIALKPPVNVLAVADPTHPNIIITNPTISSATPALAQTNPVISLANPGAALPKYTGTVPKSNRFKPVLADIASTSPGFDPSFPSSSSSPAFTDAVQTFNTGSFNQSNQTPVNESRLPIDFTKETEHLIDECIKNGLKVVETIRNQANELGPLLRNALARVNKGTQAAISFKDTILKVNTAIATGNKEQMLQDFEIIMQDVHEMSKDNMLHLSEVIYSIYITKLKSNFQETDVELNQILNNSQDGTTRELIRCLIGHNQIIINALLYVSKMIPEDHKIKREMIKLDVNESSNIIAPERNNSISTSRKSMSASGMAKKLFILGQSLNIPKGTHVENTQIEVRLQSENTKQPTLREDGKYRDRLSGFMRSENGDLEEVLLVLKEHIQEQPEIASPNEPSNARPKMMAFIDNEMLDVDEVTYLPQKPKTNTVVALMKDIETNQTHEVQMTLVPKSPNESAEGNVIALIPFASPISFLDSSSELSLIDSSFEGPGGNTVSKSKKLLKTAKLLKNNLFPKSPRTKKVIATPNFKSHKFPGQSQQNPRPVLQTFDDWISKMNENDDQPLGPDNYQEVVLDLPEEEPSKILQSQLMIEQGKMLCKSMQNDLEILKVIEAVRFPNKPTPEKQNISSYQDKDQLNEAEYSRQIEHTAIQELINFLQPIELSILPSASSPNKSSIIPSVSSPNESSVLSTASSPNLESVLNTQLDQIVTTSSIIREQLDKSLDEMVKEIQNSDDPIPEYERALKIARLKKEAMKKEIIESLQAKSDTNETMVALVENPLTGEREQVLVDLIPTNPLNTSGPSHIIGFIDDFESEAMPEFVPRSMDYSFSEKITPGKVKALPFFVTPPRVEESHKSDKKRSLHHTDSRAPKTADFGFTKSIFNQNIIANDPDLFEEELELVNDPLSGYDQAAFIAKKMRDELEQILLAESPTQVEKEPPINNNTGDTLRRQLFFDPLLTPNFVEQQQGFAVDDFILQPLSQSLDEPGQSQNQGQIGQQLLNNQTQQSSPIRSMLQSPIQSGQSPIDQVEQLFTLVDPGQVLLDNQTQQIVISLLRPNQNQQNILQEILIPLAIPTYNVSVSPNQSNSNQVGHNPNPTLLSPDQHFFQQLPPAQEILANESLPLYDSPDQTLNQSVQNPIQTGVQYVQLLNKIAGGEFLVDQIQPFI